jgi:hypothetical protein
MAALETIEFKRRFDDDTQLCWPSAGIEKTSLRNLVQTVVWQINPSELIPVAGGGSGMACQPRFLLGLLTYCYAAGIFSSQEIEAMVRKDAILSLLCGQDLPDGRIIRRFRRYNRAVIHRCLAATLDCVPRPSAARAPSGLADEDQMSSAEQTCNTLDQEHCAQDANARIQWAVNLDHMYLDE